MASLLATTGLAQDLTVGVSWADFREERWKADEAGIKGALEAAGADYISADAQGSSAKQLADVERLITDGADALIILAEDAATIGPAIDTAAGKRIPVVAYDRLIEDPRAFYLTFDNVKVGRMQAREVLKQAPEGNYAMIKGPPTDPNADILRHGQQQVLQEAVDTGRIRIVGEAYTDGWLPANAQRNMAQILTRNNNEVDAVVASNDDLAGGVVAALTAQGLEGIPVSGQDGDKAALNRVALGTQAVSVWKDARQLGRRAGEIAVALAGGTALDAVEGAEMFATPGGNEMNAILLAPVPITSDEPEGSPRCRVDHQGRALRRRAAGQRRRLQLRRSQGNVSRHRHRHLLGQDRALRPRPAARRPGQPARSSVSAPASRLVRAGPRGLVARASRRRSARSPREHGLAGPARHRPLRPDARRASARRTTTRCCARRSSGTTAARMAECAEIEAAFPRAREVAGNIAMPGFTAPKIAWVRKHEPEIFAAIDTVLLPKDYVRLRLTGHHVSEMSDAAGTLWLDVGRARLVGRPARRRPASPRATCRGSSRAARRRASSCPSSPQRWGIDGAGRGRRRRRRQRRGRLRRRRRARPATAFVSIGTSGVLFVSNARFSPNTEGAVHAFCHAIPDTWHQMGVILSASDSLEWLARITGSKPAELADAVGAGRRRRRDVIFLPYLSGERTPHNDAGARGAFVGLAQSHRRRAT